MGDIKLPELILLEEYEGNYGKYIDAIYEVFMNDFIRRKAYFDSKEIKVKFHPGFQERYYTFYHMTHIGEDEENRTPDLRRCERISWAKPIIENFKEWNLKIWPQVRNGKNRICIWLELENEPDYFVIIELRENFNLLWTAFVAEYPHQKRKKLREYNEWLKAQ